MDARLERLSQLADKISSYEINRTSNKKHLEQLYEKLKINEKVENFDRLFDYKAINLSGISLKDAHVGEIQTGKYVQIIAIAYINERGKMRPKNINLRYFGKSDHLEEGQKRDIVEFVLRWRLEKSYMGVDHYRKLLEAGTCQTNKQLERL